MRIFTAFSLFVFTAFPSVALDRCLVGVWTADGADMASVMASQTGATVRHTGGRTSLEISSSGVVEMLSQNMTYQMQPAGGPMTELIVEGYSRGTMDADGGRFQGSTADFNLVGRANIMGEMMEIPVSNGSAGWGAANGTYSCSGDTATFSPAQVGSFPRKWSRVR